MDRTPLDPPPGSGHLVEPVGIGADGLHVGAADVGTIGELEPGYEPTSGPLFSVALAGLRWSAKQHAPTIRRPLR